MTPNGGENLFHSVKQLPSLGPRKGFLSWHGALQGPSTLLRKQQIDTIRCFTLARCGGPRTLLRTTNPNLDFVFETLIIPGVVNPMYLWCGWSGRWWRWVGFVRRGFPIPFRDRGDGSLHADSFAVAQRMVASTGASAIAWGRTSSSGRPHHLLLPIRGVNGRKVVHHFSQWWILPSWVVWRILSENPS